MDVILSHWIDLETWQWINVLACIAGVCVCSVVSVWRAPQGASERAVVLARWSRTGAAVLAVALLFTALESFRLAITRIGADHMPTDVLVNVALVWAVWAVYTRCRACGCGGAHG